MLHVRERYSSSTYQNYVKTLRRFFRDYLKRPEYIGGIPFKGKPDPPKRIKLPTLKQLQKIALALPAPEERAMFLFYATTGLRRDEVRNLTWGEIDETLRAVMPKHWSRTKKGGVTFYSEDTAAYIQQLPHDRDRVFALGIKRYRRIWDIATHIAGFRITPQVLRVWFAMEMRKRGVADSFIDIFQGRAPRNVLERHYTDRNALEMLKEVYDSANLRILHV